MKSRAAGFVKRLSYADARPAVPFLLGLAAALAVSAYVYSQAHVYSHAMGNYTSDEIYYVDVARRMLQRVFGVDDISWWPFSGKTREDYMNYEHPPLGKYIIAASMAACGDSPPCWRLPGVLEASALPVILYIGYYVAGSRAASPWVGAAAGTAAAAAAGSDRILLEEAAVAMLDVHVAFFTALAIAAAAAGRPRLALAFGALASAVKYSGVFVVPAVVLAARASGRVGASRLLAEAVLAVFLVHAVLWAPLAAYRGGVVWVLEEVAAAAEWHTTARGSGPPTSPPWLWALNFNPSKLSYSPYLGGEVTTALHLAGAAAAAASLLAGPRRGCPCPGSYAVATIFLGYVAIYLAGNTTLYSFYAVQFTPAVAGALGELALLGALGARRRRS